MNVDRIQIARQHAAALPRLSLGIFPTPLRRLELPTGAIWVKDDARASPIYGGNKVRKLELLLGQLTELGRRRLVVWGDVESHTVAAVARLGRHAGFGVDAVVFPSRPSTADAEVVCSDLTEAGVVVHRARTLPTAWARAVWMSKRCGATLVPLGASTPRAEVGHALAAIEFLVQADAAKLAAGRIYLPLGSGGTVAGVLVGLALGATACRLVAVRTVDRIVSPEHGLRRRVRQIVRELALPASIVDDAMGRLDRLDNRYLGRTYRDLTPASLAAVETAERAGLRLEPVFGGKAFACLLDDLAAQPSWPLIFWNTHDAGR